jgi:peptidoglycan/LPS O-acetylase OafA/YrhL
MTSVPAVSPLPRQTPTVAEGTSTASSRLKPLAGLPCIAALLVVFHNGSLAMPGCLPNIIVNGCAGVSLFFVLSGFILPYNCPDARGQMRVGRRDF